ncbi:hypothetical protein BDA96_01G199600 [Sorghum bicolor]|uniref:10 kDa chaperonin n=2 Tax=Sorghum bicolor TaxID=4558 RepID=A0A921RZR2_SORBI|nr:hypothetical protein BDA96_01G199600 [Sorghum bicolor]OQU91489.1 hypothetical protein SORBI_3001G189750 [Sorghum bicolor]
MIVRFYYPREFEKERQGIMRRIPSYHDHGSIEEENSSQVIAVGPGDHDRDGKLISVSLSEGDTIMLPEYGGTKVKLAERVC